MYQPMRLCFMPAVLHAVVANFNTHMLQWDAYESGRLTYKRYLSIVTLSMSYNSQTNPSL
jgi:hypothetical protein